VIPQSFIDDLLRRVDIVDLVGQHVPLKKAGTNYSGLCPFHTEKSPSFSVSPTKQFYHCFGCGAHGTAIGFLIEHLGLSFPQAVEELARRHGMEVPQTQETSADAQTHRKTQADLKARLEARLLEAAKFYQRRLKDAPHAIAYLKNRGISGESAARYHLGYAPEGWQSLQAVFGDYHDAELVQAGLVITSGAPETVAVSTETPHEPGREVRRYDRFRNRIMFPILGSRGEVLGFGARALGDETPKYLNSPETPIFTKGSGLYGLFEARQAIRQAGEIWVVEGYMDVVVLAQYGLGHAVATLGTATTAEHLRVLSRQTSRLVFMFDGDSAGQKAAARALEIALPFAHERLQIRFAFLPPEHDPDSFVRAHGAEALRGLVSEAPALSRFILQRAAQDQSLALAEGRAVATAEARRLLALMPDSALKAQIAQEAVQAFQTDLQSLGFRAAPAGGYPAKPTHTARPPASLYAQPTAGSRPASGPSAPPPPARQADRILQILIQHPHRYPQLARHSAWVLAQQQLSAEQNQLLSWLSLHETAAGQAGLFEAIQREDPQSGAALAFRRLSRPDPALEALFQSDTPEVAVDGELERAIRVLAIRTMQSQANDLARKQPLAPEDLLALRRIQESITQAKSVLMGSDERTKI
jgi:DNA primase